MAEVASDLSATERSYCHTRFAKRKGSILWKISGFMTQCPCLNGEFLTSPDFGLSGDDRVWSVKLYPKGEAGVTDSVSLFLHRMDVVDSVFVTCEFALMDNFGDKLYQNTFSTRHSGDYGYPKFVELSELLEYKHQLLPKDELTVSCVVSLQEKVETSFEDASLLLKRCPLDITRSTLSEDMKRFFEDMKFADVVLKTNDTDIPAHRMILACRSPYLARLLEVNKKRIALQIDIESQVITEIVRFLYTDEMSHRDVSSSLKLLTAAVRLQLPSLRARCVNYVLRDLSVDNVFDVLLVSDACKEVILTQACIDLIVREFSSEALLRNWIWKLYSRLDILEVLERVLSEV